MALSFSNSSARVVYSNIGNMNFGAKSILLDFFMPSNALQANSDFFSATRNSGNDTFQNFLLQLSDEGGTINSVRAAHFGSVTGHAYTASNVLSVGQWNRIVWTCSNCAEPSPVNTKIYVNAISQENLGGSVGSNIGLTNGDVCIGNRAHLDRGIDGQIARFAVVNRVATENEIQKFEVGLKPSEIFPSGNLLLAPKTLFFENWESEISGAVNAAVLSNVTHVQDPTYGIVSVANALNRFSQRAVAQQSGASTQRVLQGITVLHRINQSAVTNVQVSGFPLEVVGNFDGGTVDSAATLIVPQAAETSVTLVPRKFAYRDTSRDWLTIQARVNNVGGAGPIKFLLAETDFDLDQRFTSETKLWWRPVSSTKNDWALFEHNILTNGVLSAYNSSEFNTSDIFVGDQPGYYYGEIVDDVSNWLSSPYVTSPQGADISGAVSTLSSTSDEFGRFSGELNQHAIKISDAHVPEHPELKNKIRILIFANIHPGEMVAKWAVKGFVDWLIGGSAEASSTRKNFEIFIVWVNATGLFLGHPVGSELTGPYSNKNLNRDWGDFNLEATRKARDWIAGNIGSDIAYVIDFHNLTWGNSDGIFRDPTSLSLAFCDAVDLHYSGSIVQQANTASAGFTTFYYKSTYGIDGATLEPRRGSNDLTSYQEFGRAVGHALQHMLNTGAFGRFGTVSVRLPSPNISSSICLTQKSNRAKISPVLW